MGVDTKKFIKAVLRLRKIGYFLVFIKQEPYETNSSL